MPHDAARHMDLYAEVRATEVGRSIGLGPPERTRLCHPNPYRVARSVLWHVRLRSRPHLLGGGGYSRTQYRWLAMTGVLRG